MIRGIAASRAGMAWEQSRADVIANNVANINTQGFKRSVAVGAEFGEILIRRMGDQESEASNRAIGALGNGAVLALVATEGTTGALLPSDNPLDVALTGEGEFTFETPAGRGYTRSGSFHRSADGTLVTTEGFPLLVGGRSVGAGAKSVVIRPDAEVVVDGQSAGRLDIRGGAATRLEVGALEASNVDLARETTDLITALRSFQVNQRALQVQDQILAKAVSELGRL